MLLALVAGGPASDALADRSTAVVWVVAALAWGAWAAGLAAMLVPRTSSLTVVRVVVPASWIAAAAAVAEGATSTVLDGVLLVVATGSLVLALAPWVTDAFVDGSSYGPERRIPLRTPITLTAVAVAAWAVALAGALIGPLLLATRQWAAGGVALVVGAALSALAVRGLHQLSKRWLVLVPTGLVLHDPITMPEPQLFLRQTMRRLGPAAADAVGSPPVPRTPTEAHEATGPSVDDVEVDEALVGTEGAAPAPRADGVAGVGVTEDLSAGAAGLIMALELTEPVELLVRNGRGTTLRQVDRVLFSPSRPAELLAAARERRLPVA